MFDQSAGASTAYARQFVILVREHMNDLPMQEARAFPVSFLHHHNQQDSLSPSNPMNMQQDLEGNPRGRMAIPRRSCDQCRARKIACEREQPCSNCTSARLTCTYSAVASNTRAPRQRVLISTEYEKKIDTISKSVEAIQTFLETSQGLNTTSSEPSRPHHKQTASIVKAEVRTSALCAPGNETQWDHSAHVIDFIRAFVEEKGDATLDSDASQVISSLKAVLGNLESSSGLVIPKHTTPTAGVNPSMPPLDASVAILRWAQDHRDYATVVRMSHILPLERLADICRKIYFAVEDYNEVEFIIANGYLYHIFSEHAAGSGREDYRHHGLMCERNMFNAFSRLPLLLATSMEAIAALVFGVLDAIENSKASLAWSFISTAATQCQSLGYHRAPPGRAAVPKTSQRLSQERLFWTVYRMDRALSLRLGRAPNIQESEITLTADENALKFVQLATIQGKVYEQLYSPAALSVHESTTRVRNAQLLSEQLQVLIDETRAELEDTTAVGCDTADPLREYYLHCDLVCQSSLLTLILRAIPLPLEPWTEHSTNYVTVARSVFDMHHQCMSIAQALTGGFFIHTKYLNLAILNTPFIPFTILFTRVLQCRDFADLAALKRFADSLRPDPVMPQSVTHPHQLYDLLCRAADVYIRTDSVFGTGGFTMVNKSTHDLADTGSLSNRLQLEMEYSAMTDGAVSDFDGLDDWFQSNQQLINLLDGNPTS